MKVKNLIKKRHIKYDYDVNMIKVNSKEVLQNDIFFSMNNNDEYINEAVTNGCNSIVLSDYKKYCYYKDKYRNINIIYNKSIIKLLSNTLINYYKIKYGKNIIKELNIIGITGTNGKTTISTLFYKYCLYNNIKCTYIGSNGAFINNKHLVLNNTTPDIYVIYKILEESYCNNINKVIMEVSSHAIKERRIEGLHFNIKLLTNITRDHLDYHKCFKDYKNTKLSFLLKDKISKIIYTSTKYKSKRFLKFDVSYISSNENDKYCYYEKTFNLTSDQTTFQYKHNNDIYQVKTNLLGRYNVYNIIGFIAITNIVFNFQFDFSFFNQLLVIPGRMNRIKNVYIDYAHTPDGLYETLHFLRSIANKKLISVYGCGGARDTGKRTIMGQIGLNICDYVIFTNDNPRNEDQDHILFDIIHNNEQYHNYEIIKDRKQAIKKAMDIINDEDILAILGRGCDDYYIVNNKKIYFNDYEYVKGLLNEK